MTFLSLAAHGPLETHAGHQGAVARGPGTRDEHIPSFGDGACAQARGGPHTRHVSFHVACVHAFPPSVQGSGPTTHRAGRVPDRRRGLRRLCRCAGRYRAQPVRDVPAPPRPRAPGLLPAGPPQLDPDPNLCTSGPLASPQPHAPPQPAPHPPRLGLARTRARRERPQRPRSIRTTAARRLPSDLTGAPVK